jgi:hypothetical protein
MIPQGNSSDTRTSQGTGVYGPWPVNGEIDVSLFPLPRLTNIIDARSDLPSYPAQGSNYVRSSILHAANIR